MQGSVLYSDGMIKRAHNSSGYQYTGIPKSPSEPAVQEPGSDLPCEMKQFRPYGVSTPEGFTVQSSMVARTRKGLRSSSGDKEGLRAPMMALSRDASVQEQKLMAAERAVLAGLLG